MKRIYFAVSLLCLPIAVYGQGPLLWELQEDIHGGIDLARAITISGRTAVVVGNGGVPEEGTDGSDFVIQALSRATGTVQWSDEAFLSIGAIEPLFVTSRKNRVYAVGTLRQPGDVRSAFLVRAYEVPSGTLLWQNVWHAGQGVDTDHPTGILASPTQVVVVGYSENATREGLAAVVRAYEPVSGAFLWEDRAGNTGLDVIAWAIAADRNRVFLAGTTSPADNPSVRDLFVRAYDASSGDVDWQIGRQSVIPTKLILASGRLLVAGAAANGTYLAAFSAASGVRLWQDTAPTAGTLVDIAVKGPRIAAAILGRQSAVRAYNLITGRVEWEDRLPIRPGFQQLVFAVAQNNDSVFAAGSSGQDFGNSEFMVRAYDARKGTLLWDDRCHPSEQTAAVDLTVDKSRLFVAGYTSDGVTSTDFLIRAYDVQHETTGTQHSRE